MKKPGEYRIANGATVMEALMLAGGPYIALAPIQLTREVDGKLMTVRVRPLAFIQRGDVLTVLRRRL